MNGSWLGTSKAWIRAAARRLGAPNPFEPSRLVWSRGLALLCDHNGGLAFVRERPPRNRPPLRLDLRAFRDVKDGDLVWTRVTALPQFVEEVLPTIRARFALLTGDEDWSIPSDFEGARTLLEDDRVLCWFTQNFDGTDRSGKLAPLPIGIDFHTISFRGRWGHVQATPREQEQELDAVRVAMPANSDRLRRVHADFHFNKQRHNRWGENRGSVEASLRHNPCVDFQQEMLPRLELWREKTRYAFVVSPHGNGLDCHRTWESLALGNIVIVKRSPLDPLYEGLPVVLVDDWSEITAERLQEWQRRHCEEFADPDSQRRLTNRYWIDQVRARVKERLASARGAA